MDIIHQTPINVKGNIAIMHLYISICIKYNK